MIPSFAVLLLSPPWALGAPADSTSFVSPRLEAYTCHVSTRATPAEIDGRRAEAFREAELYRSDVELPALAGYRAMLAAYAPRVRAAARDMESVLRRLRADQLYFQARYPDPAINSRFGEMERLLGGKTGLAARLSEGARGLDLGLRCADYVLARAGDVPDGEWGQLQACRLGARAALSARPIWVEELEGARTIMEEDGRWMLERLDGRLKDPAQTPAQRREHQAAHTRIQRAFEAPGDAYRRPLEGASEALAAPAWDLLAPAVRRSLEPLRARGSERAASFGGLAAALQAMVLPRVPAQFALERTLILVLERMGACLDELLRLEAAPSGDAKTAALEETADRSLRSRFYLMKTVRLLEELREAAAARLPANRCSRSDGRAPAGLAAGSPF